MFANHGLDSKFSTVILTDKCKCFTLTLKKN